MTDDPQPRLADVPAIDVSSDDWKLVEVWKAISVLVHRLRHSSLPTASNQTLKDCIESDPKGALAPFFQLWIGDNHRLAGQHRAAIGAYRELASRWPERKFHGQALGASALELAASCHEQLGEPDEAIAALRAIPALFDGACYPAWLLFRIGLVAEKAGPDRYDEAIEAYDKAAQTVDPYAGPCPTCRDSARRNAARLRSDRRWMRRSADELAAELTAALRKRDVGALKELASPTHFSVGMMWSERCYADSEPLLELLGGDIASEALSVPEGFHDAAKDKVYLPTDGWRGDFFSGPVMFVLSKGPGGAFEWSGVSLTRLPTSAVGLKLLDRMRPKGDPNTGGGLPGDHREPPEPPPSPPGGGGTPSPPPSPPAMPVLVTDLKLKCPWPQGTAFYAGGLIKLGIKLAAFDGPLIAGAALAVPLVGPILSATIFAASGVAAAIAQTQLLLDFARDFPCGLGAGGLYYNQPTTHVGSSSFAVDFATFPIASPPIGPVSVSVYVANNMTLGQPTLAVADGIVVGTLISTVARGADPGFANEVNVDLVSTKEQGALAAAFFIALFTGVFPPLKLRFSSRYMHMDGPGLVPVSLGMFVRQGARLGPMDDTGLSQAQHLHFELIDTTTGVTVKPTPMDGQTLEDWDDGRCMHSTNVPIP